MLSLFKNLQTRLAQCAAVAALALTANVSLADEAQLQLAQTSDGFDASAKYMASCFACHSTGAAGAPKVQAGVYESDWVARLEKGREAMMSNVINGINAMPAKGMCFDCTDADLEALVDYMIESSK